MRLLVEGRELETYLGPLGLKCREATFFHFSFVVHPTSSMEKVFGASQLLEGQIELPGTYCGGGSFESAIGHRGNLYCILVGNRLGFERFLQAVDFGLDLWGNVIFCC